MNSVRLVARRPPVAELPHAGPEHRAARSAGDRRPRPGPRRRPGVPMNSLDGFIRRVLEHGYCHHLEKLMVLGNISLSHGDFITQPGVGRPCGLPWESPGRSCDARGVAEDRWVFRELRPRTQPTLGLEPGFPPAAPEDRAPRSTIREGFGAIPAGPPVLPDAHSPPPLQRKWRPARESLAKGQARRFRPVPRARNCR
jgi:hypothetical protein